MTFLSTINQHFRSIKIGLWVLAVTTIGISSYFITQKELLRYESLAFYSGIWLTLWLLRFRPNNIKARLLILCSALLLGASFPPYPWLLVFVGFVPLLVLFDEHRRLHTPRRKVFGDIYLVMLGFNIFATYWVANTAFLPMIVAFLLNALFMSIPLMLFYALRVYLRSHLHIWLFAFAWISYEFLHHRWELSWIWLTLGNAPSSSPWLLQWYEYTGALGGSLWILLVNYLIYIVITTKRKGTIIELGALLIIPLTSSLLLYWQTIPSHGTANVAVINPNYEPNLERQHYSNEDRLQLIEAMLDTQDLSQVELIALPEGYFAQLNLGHLQYESIARRLQAYANQYDINFASGAMGYQIFENYKPNRPNVRPMRRDPNAFWEAYNNAICIRPHDSIQVYNKVKFVPGAEMFSYKQFLGFLEPIVERAHGSLYGLATYPRDEIFSLLPSGTKMAPIVCYDANYGEYCTGAVKKGASFFSIVSEDGWWGKTKGYSQFRYIHSLRAIECRRAIARAANYGQCVFVDAKGKPLSTPSAYAERTLMRQEVPLHNKLTVYTRWGDYVGRLALGALLFITLIGLSDWLKQKLNIS